MAFFKRTEVWILALLCAGVVGWVFWSERVKDREAEFPASQNQTPNPSEDLSTRIEIKERRLSREGDHLILVVTIQRKEPGRPEESDQKGAVELLTENGESVEPFFFPFDPEPTLDQHTGAEMTIRYWLPVNQLSGELWLQCEGQRLQVKATSPDSGTGGDAPDFPDGVEVVVSGPNWER